MNEWICKRFKVIITLVAALTLVGCANQQRYDYSALEQSAPRSILVIPPLNNSVEVNAPYIYISTISRPLAEKGYYVFPVAVIDRFMKENGLPTPHEMNSVPLSKLAEHIGPDAVLYVTIEDWGQKYHIVASKTVVKAKMRLVDARTGKQIWHAYAYREIGSGDGGGGLAGMLIGALVEQIAGSMSDRTPMVATQANHFAIYNPNVGLLDGPYKKR